MPVELLSLLKRIALNSSNILSVLIVLVVGMLLVPLPAFVLDILFVINFSISIGIILVTLYVKEPLEFSTFPTVLLLVTLARLALEISATRSILLNGHAGNVIHSIGEFVVGGNYVVGIIIFIILFIVNFVVVTQGAGRVSEVAARFSLDSMPGKQLAVDADLNAGIIDEDTAKKRRASISKEADFYATMDGGSKFVKGDAIASVIIAVINIAAGFIIGMVQLKMSAADSASLYTLLTIGEGLAAQIPAFIISVATGIIVTRSSPDLDLAQDIGVQLFAKKEVIAVSSGALFLMGVGIPGAFLPFILVSGILGYWAYRKYRAELDSKSEDLIYGPDGQIITREEQQEIESREKLKRKEEDNSPEGVIKLLKIDQIEVEIGYKLIGLLDPAKDGDLMSRIGQIRRQVMIDMGLPVPAIRVHDNLQVGPNEYQVKLRGAVIAKNSIVADKFLAVNTGLVDQEDDDLEGIETTEPSYGLPARWIQESQREKAESLGYTVATPSSVLATHLTEVIRIHAAEILSRQDLTRMVEHVKEHNESIVEEINNHLSMGELLGVLQCLLREQVSIRDLSTVLEYCANYSKVSKDPDFLAERIREGMGRQICSEYLIEGKLNCATFHPAIEEEMINAVHLDRLALDPTRTKGLLEKIHLAYQSLTEHGFPAVILCNNKIRLPLRRIIERVLPQLAIIAYSEVPSNMDAQSVYMISDKQKVIDKG
jgi:flagellar biosynthesis protein FlhA